MPDVQRDMKGFSSALDKLSAAIEKMTQAAESHSDRPQDNIKVYQVLARQTLDTLRPRIKEMLIANYEKSGLEDKTGKLRTAIGNVVIGAKFDARRPWRIYVKFPAGEEDYVDKKTGAKSNPYKVWASLGHGWTRTGKGAAPVSAKAKASGKRNALKHEKTSFKRKGNKYTVVPPRPFFFLDGSQQSEIQQQFVATFEAKVAEATKRR